MAQPPRRQHWASDLEGGAVSRDADLTYGVWGTTLVSVGHLSRLVEYFSVPLGTARAVCQAEHGTVALVETDQASGKESALTDFPPSPSQPESCHHSVSRLWRKGWCSRRRNKVFRVVRFLTARLPSLKSPRTAARRQPPQQRTLGGKSQPGTSRNSRRHFDIHAASSKP